MIVLLVSIWAVYCGRTYPQTLGIFAFTALFTVAIAWGISAISYYLFDPASAEPVHGDIYMALAFGALALAIMLIAGIAEITILRITGKNRYLQAAVFLIIAGLSWYYRDSYRFYVYGSDPLIPDILFTVLAAALQLSLLLKPAKTKTAVLNR
jgi:hypothetical protein